MSELKFEIVKHIGVIGEGKEGWKKEINVVSWNERKPKLDIREWDENHEKMKKGITFNEKEMENLKSILSDLDTKCLEVNNKNV